MTIPESKAAPHILVVEDDEDVSDLFDYALRSAGYSVTVAHSLKEVDAILEKSPVSLMLTDWNLTDGTAASLCDKLQIHNGLAPIILVSGRVDLHTIQIAHCRVDAWLSKPVTTEQLLSVVRQLLEQSSASLVQ